MASSLIQMNATFKKRDYQELNFQRRHFGGSPEELETLVCKPLQSPAGVLDDSPHSFIPQNSLHEVQGRTKKRVLVLCTGGTLTMAPDPKQNGALAPVEGAISRYMDQMDELKQENSEMPDYVLHEYSPFRDSSDLGPADWATIAEDIESNYSYFDGFVVLTGTDTMAYIATALSFMLENLNKPVVFTGSQIPLCMPQNDARRNLIMAMIFASRDSINEVCIFFHDRLLRANRTTKVNTHKLLAFDSPNIDALATIGISINENDHLLLPPARGALRVHLQMDPRLLTIRLVPGFDDGMIRQMVEINAEKQQLRALVLQLYGTGNIPSVKESFIQLLADATDKGILVIASTQCSTGSVLLGQYATGRALLEAGAVSAGDMTVEAIACKSAYLFGRKDLNNSQIVELMGVSLRGEMTPHDQLSPPHSSNSFEQCIAKARRTSGGN
jgi:L-asparaginase